jgi:UDP-N-acetylglucosamine 2-epimerase
MSHLHFTSTEAYRKRVIQLGEQPERVFNVGALGVENVMKNDFMSKDGDRAEFELPVNRKVFPLHLSSRYAQQYVLRNTGAEPAGGIG